MRKYPDKRLPNRHKSVITYLKNGGLLNDSMLVNINKLSLEDLIAIKLELSVREFNNRLYGFDIWRKFNNITKEALLKFAISATHSKADAARFLGLDTSNFSQVYKQYEIEEFFSDETST